MAHTKKKIFLSQLAAIQAGRREHFFLDQTTSESLSLREAFVEAIWIVSYFIFRPIFRALGKVEIRYLDPDFDHVRRPIILMTNHQGMLDPWIISSSLPFAIFKRLLPIRPYATKRITDKSKLLYWLDKLNFVKIIYYLYDVLILPPKEASFDEKLAPSLEALANHESLIFFPEGGLTLTDEIRPFRRGIVEIQRRTGVPILPCTIRYHRHGWIRYHITVTIGQPLFIPEEILKRRETKQAHFEGSEYLRAEMVRLYER